MCVWLVRVPRGQTRAVSSCFCVCLQAKFFDATLKEAKELGVLMSELEEVPAPDPGGSDANAGVEALEDNAAADETAANSRATQSVAGSPRATKSQQYVPLAQLNEQQVSSCFNLCTCAPKEIKPSSCAVDRWFPTRLELSSLRKD